MVRALRISLFAVLVGCGSTPEIRDVRAPVPEADHGDDELTVSHLIDDPVITHPNAPEIASAGHSFHAKRAW